MTIGVYGAGGFTRQIIELLPPDVLLFTDEGGPPLFGYRVLRFAEAPACDLAIAVSDPEVRRRVASGWRHGFASIVAASAEISPHAFIGKGAIVCRQAIIEADVRIGVHFHANLGAIVGHECHFGDFATLGPGVMVCGACRLGNGVTLGAGAIIKQGLAIGDNAKIGMGAVVHKDVPTGAAALGNPARIMNPAAVQELG